VAPAPRAVEHDTDSVVPEELAVGIGFGWTFPQSLENPNTVTANVRFPSGLTLEPRIVLQNQETTVDPGVPGGMSTTDKVSDLAVALLVRYPVMRHGRFELELQGAAGVSRHKVDPDGPDNETTTSSQVISWGIGVNYWLSRHWALLASASNPLLARTSEEKPDGLGDTMTTTSTTYGIVFDPTVSFVIQLYH
jgi:hypothetical protein